jgi:hypothetical protein
MKEGQKDETFKKALRGGALTASCKGQSECRKVAVLIVHTYLASRPQLNTKHSVLSACSHSGKLRGQFVTGSTAAGKSNLNSARIPDIDDGESENSRRLPDEIEKCFK